MHNPNNHLHNETSPYLLQHADNPVNWFGWNQQSLDLAKKENKPILLSIGYSACHWCHVMAHESFEDEQTAQLMNELFINIKIDREERPDLDKIYQSAHSILTGRAGGWPLTIFISPDDQMPFYAGTYFPDKPRYNMPSFQEILKMISNAYKTKKEDIEKQNSSLRDMLNNISKHDKNPELTLNALPLDLARKQIESQFEPVHGGFSDSPKFPHPAIIERALRHWHLITSQQHEDQRILEIALFSLKKMALGGIFDHLGGGFCRYSTDDKWIIPHFEKMLYDNGQLLPLYCYAYQISQDPVFKRSAQKTAEWVLREMQSTEGGYFSAQDADSEGAEGKFFIWTPKQVEALLNNDSYSIFATCYGLDKKQNFDDAWHLHTYTETAELSKKYALPENEIEAILEDCRKALFIEREKRIAPGRDDKILTSWNGLMIRGMLISSRVLNKPEYAKSAKLALDFIHKQLWKNKQLLVTYKDNKAHLNAYLDDYAYLLLALIEYLQQKWDNNILNWAIEIADALLENFEDKENGGFYFTSHNHEQLIQRSKTFSDDAMPSGSAIAASSLQQLGLLIGNNDYLNSAENCIKAGYNNLQTQAATHCSLLHALEEYLNPQKIIILRGEQSDIDEWRKTIQQNYRPGLLCFAINSNEQTITAIATKTPMNTTCAYICEGSHCLSPVTDINELNKLININETII
jgi:uncharacterized protein